MGLAQCSSAVPKPRFGLDLATVAKQHEMPTNKTGENQHGGGTGIDPDPQQLSSKEQASNDGQRDAGLEERIKYGRLVRNLRDDVGHCKPEQDDRHNGGAAGQQELNARP